MTQQEKQLLLKDLCARLPCGVIVHYDDYWDKDYPRPNEVLTTYNLSQYEEDLERWNVKPYLRPMSSMTNEEWCEYCDSCAEDEKEVIITHKGYRIVPTTHKEHFFNIHHFDYRGLIEKGLALEAPEGMYKLDKESK